MQLPTLALLAPLVLLSVSPLSSAQLIDSLLNAGSSIVAGAGNGLIAEATSEVGALLSSIAPTGGVASSFFAAATSAGGAQLTSVLPTSLLPTATTSSEESATSPAVTSATTSGAAAAFSREIHAGVHGAVGAVVAVGVMQVMMDL